MFDKSAWPPGEWQYEYDEMLWVDDATELPCYIQRKSFGILCGYVGVPSSHSLYGKDIFDSKVLFLDVHGRITFANYNSEFTQNIKIPNEFWWFGFDCAHFPDRIPTIPSFLGPPTSIYRNIPYVMEQLTQLAKQLRDIP